MSRSDGRTSASTRLILPPLSPSPVCESPMIKVEDARESYGELRLRSLGMSHGRVIFLVWTPRGEDTAHLISCRYADRKETHDFFNSL